MMLINVDRLLSSIHLALVDINRAEFGNSGYDGMQNLVENDHQIILWGRDEKPIEIIYEAVTTPIDVYTG